MKHIIFYVASAALFLSIGCMKIGPDYHRPDIGIKTPGVYQHAHSRAVTPGPEDRWWEVFNDPKLNSIVEEVLKHNLDIKKATAGILEVRSLFTQSRADRYPVLNLEGQGKHQSQTVIVTSTQGQSQWKREKSDSYTLSLPATFELDLWGRLARAEEAVRADLLQAQENRRIVTQTVVAETISLYLQIESLERRIQVALLKIGKYRDGLNIIKYRYEHGLVSILDLKQARQTLAEAEASLHSLRQELGISQQKMAVLLGRYPKTTPPRPQPEDYFKDLATVPAGLPSEILLRRPDIGIAEAKLKALNARVGAAKASRFPRITLTGSFGYSSEDLDSLVRPQSELWNLALGIVQPLFDAGKLRAGQRAAEAKYQQGVADYAKTVLTAFSEVESALLTRKEQIKRRELLLSFLMEARATHEITENRYRLGLVDYMSVLQALQARFQAEGNLILVDLAILSNRVTLHRALGGGWGELEKVMSHEHN